MHTQRLHLAVLLFYLGVAIWLSWPLATDLTGNLYVNPGGPYFFSGHEDAIQNTWNMWWTSYAVLQGMNPFVTPLLYYPEGVSLYLQTVNYATTFLVLPVTLTVGADAAYNTALLLGYQLTGYAGFLLARRYVQAIGPSLLAGLLLTATPHHVGKMDVGQLNFVTTQWLFIAMAALVLLSERASLGRMAAAALALALTVFTDWYLALVAAFFACGWALLSSLRAQQPWRSLAWFAGCGLLSGLLLAPLLPGLLSLRGPSEAVDADRQALWTAIIQGNSVDGLGLFFPAALHPLWYEPVGRILMELAPSRIMEGSYHASGWVLLSLGSLGVFWYGRQHWPWLVLSGLAWLFAVGPTLYLLGYNTGLPMPYRLLQGLPLLDTARRPGLFILIAHGALTVFAALALQRLGHGLPQAKRLGLWAGVLALACFELTPGPRRVVLLEPAPVFAQIARERPGVVVDLPIEIFPESRTLLNQIMHQQPILRGYVARAPASYDTLKYAPLVNALGEMRPWPEQDIVPLDRANWQAQQCFYRMRNVVVAEDLVKAEEQAQLRANLTRLTGGEVQAWYRHAGFRAYELPLYADQCQAFLYLGPGWHDIEQDEGRSWRWTNGASVIYVVNPQTTPATVSLELQATAHGAERLLRVHDGRQVVVEVPITALPRQYRFALILAPGLNRFVMESATTSDPESTRQLGISVQQMVVE
jgi:hypothetical protein